MRRWLSFINGTLRVLREQKRGKLLQYGERIWGIAGGTEEERIDRTIAANEAFFRSLGLSTRLSEEGIGEETVAEIERRFNAGGWKYGEEGECRWRYGPADSRSLPLTALYRIRKSPRPSLVAGIFVCGTECLFDGEGRDDSPFFVETVRVADCDAVFPGGFIYQCQQIGFLAVFLSRKAETFQFVGLYTAESADRGEFGNGVSFCWFRTEKC